MENVETPAQSQFSGGMLTGCDAPLYVESSGWEGHWMFSCPCRQITLHRTPSSPAQLLHVHWELQSGLMYQTRGSFPRSSCEGLCQFALSKKLTAVRLPYNLGICLPSDQVPELTAPVISNSVLELSLSDQSHPWMGLDSKL